MQKLKDYLEANSHKSVLIFDFDDTLAKMHIDWAKFEEEVHALLSEYDEELFAAHKDEHVMMLGNTFIAEYGEPIRAELDCLQRQFEGDQLEKLSPNTELIGFVRNKAQDYDMYMWTNNNSYTVDNALSLLDISDCFINVVTRDMVELGKPSAQGLYTLFGPIIPDDAKNEMVFIADDKMSAKAAEAAGVDYFKVPAYPWS